MDRQGLIIKKNPYIKAAAIIVALVMTFVTLMTCMRSYAAPSQTVYVSDVMIFYGNTFEDAKKQCEENGYIPFDCDLNEGTDNDVSENVRKHTYGKFESADEDIRRELNEMYGGLGNRVCLGYKTTLRRDEAVTDMSMLQMGLGYTNYNYSDYLKMQENRYRYLVQTIISVRGEWSANLAKHSPAADTALRTLNYYYIDEMDMLLGDYILSDKCNVDEFTSLLTRCNASVMNTIFSALVAGVADYNPDTEYVEGEYTVEVKTANPMPSAEYPEEDSSAADESSVTETTESTAPESMTDSSSEEDVSSAQDSSAADESSSAETSESTASESMTDSSSSEEAASVPDSSAADESSAAEASESMTESSSARDSSASDSKVEGVLTEMSAPSAEEVISDGEPTEDEEDEGSEEYDPENAGIPGKETGVMKCDMNYGTWADRVSKTGVIEKYESGKIAKDEEKLYAASADLAVDKLREFARDYHNAVARYNVHGNDAFESIGTAKEAKDIPDMLANSIIDNEVDETSGDAYYIGIYELLSRYEYGGGKTLAEYIVELGDRDYPDAASKYAIYPLVASMTYGQIQMMHMNGIGALATYLFNNDSLRKNADEYFEKLDKMITEERGVPNTRISVWDGVDKTIFDSQIAVTSAKQYSQDCGDVSAAQKKPFGVMTFLSKVQSCVNLSATILGGVNAALSLGSMAVNMTLTNHFTLAACAAFAHSGGVFAAILGTVGKCMIMLATWLGVAMIVLTLVVWAFDLICSHIEKDSIEYSHIPLYLADSRNGLTICYNVVQGSNGKPADIMVGMGKKSSKGEWMFNNIFDWGYNFDQRPRWNALYITHDPDAGSPLCLDENGSCFKVQKNDLSVPNSYVPMNAFNEFAAANLNSYAADESAPALYMFYHTEDSLTKLNEGTASDEGKFLNTVYFSTGETETIAKAELTRQGYKIVDRNLTPDIENVYTYMGYTEQQVADSALTDIRVASKTISAVSFGGSGYTKVGTDPKKPTLTNEDSVYYSSYTGVGDAITTDIQIVNDIKDANEGYLPITTFSGVPYNFNHNLDMDYTGIWESSLNLFDKSLDDALERIHKPVYVFYRPSVTYSAEKNKDGSEPVKYLAGITNFVFIPSRGWKRDVCEQYVYHYAEQIGAKVYKNSLLDGIRYERCGEDDWFGKNPGEPFSYFLVTTTLDPKKAIYDIKSYTSAPSSTMLPSSIGSKDIGGYVASDVLLATCYRDEYALYKLTANSMYFSSLEYADTHDYMNTTINMPNNSFDHTNKELRMLPEDFELEGYFADAPYSKVYTNYGNISERNSYLRCKNLYLEGAFDGKNPLTLDDIIFTDAPLTDMKEAPKTLAENTADKELFVSVQDVRTPNATADHDLSFRDVDGGDKAQYVYVRRFKKTADADDKDTEGTEAKEVKTTVKSQEKKYISNVMIASFNSDDKKDTSTTNLPNAYDTCIQQLLAGCTDEILPYTLTDLNVFNVKAMDTFASSDISLEELGWNLIYDYVNSDKDMKTGKPSNYLLNDWQMSEDLDGKVEHMAYLGVSRTDNASEAVTALVKYKPADGETPPDIMYMGEIKYTICGGKIHNLTGDYYLYQTTQSAAGNPITAVDFGIVPYINGAATVPYTDSEQQNKGGNIESNVTAATNFIYCYYTDNSEYIDAIYVGHGKSIFEACSDLLSSGCKYAVLYDVRKNTKVKEGISGDSEYVFIGYTTYRTTYDKKGKISSQKGVRDIVFVQPEDPNNVQKEITIDKKKYTAAKDSKGKPYPINSKENTYIYYRAATDTSKKAVPLINRLGIGERDRVPSTEELWENVLTENNERFNLNEGYIFYNKDSLATDSRAYLYCRRVPNTDKYVKPGAAIVGGHCEESVTYGAMYLQ